MKIWLFVLVLVPTIGFTQTNPQHRNDFKYSGDTIYFGNHKLLKGDTLFTGYGCGPHSEFVYIIQQTTNMKKRIRSSNTTAPFLAAYKHLIFNRIDSTEFKVKGTSYKVTEPIFRTEANNSRTEWTITSFPYALKFGEIKI